LIPPEDFPTFVTNLAKNGYVGGNVTMPHKDVALAKSEPGKLSAGTPGVGTPHHLALMMLNALAKIDILNVPYRGAAAALNDVLAGQLPMSWAAPTAVLPHVAAGRIKILGVASARRPASLPDVPTMAENGVAGFDLDIWFGVSAPAKTAPDITARLAKEIAEIVAQPDVQERIKRAGLAPAYADGAVFREQIRSDHERFGKIIRDAGIIPD
jgi:tripartite-type tricarboxylate transporter receptor subunit TctC